MQRTREVVEHPTYGLKKQEADQVSLNRPSSNSATARVLHAIKKYDGALDLVFNPLNERWELWRLRRGKRPRTERSIPFFTYYHHYTQVTTISVNGQYVAPGMWLLRWLKANDSWKSTPKEMYARDMDKMYDDRRRQQRRDDDDWKDWGRRIGALARGRISIGYGSH